MSVSFLRSGLITANTKNSNRSKSKKEKLYNPDPAAQWRSYIFSTAAVMANQSFVISGSFKEPGELHCWPANVCLRFQSIRNSTNGNIMKHLTTAMGPLMSHCGRIRFEALVFLHISISDNCIHFLFATITRRHGTVN